MKPKYDVLLSKLRVSDEYDDTNNSIRISNLENNIYEITYFEAVNSAAGTITKPVGSTIILDKFAGGINAYVSTIVNNEPTGIMPKTSLGVNVDVSSFDALGNFVLDGIPDSYPVALVYIITIPALYLVNVLVSNRIDIEETNIENVIFDYLKVRDNASPSHLWKVTIDGTGEFQKEDLGVG